jgi:hypothetical protein
VGWEVWAQLLVRLRGWVRALVRVHVWVLVRTRVLVQAFVGVWDGKNWDCDWDQDWDWCWVEVDSRCRKKRRISAARALVYPGDGSLW